MEGSNSDEEPRSLQLSRRMQTVSSLSLDSTGAADEPRPNDKGVVSMKSLGVMKASDSFYENSSERDESIHVTGQEVQDHDGNDPLLYSESTGQNELDLRSTPQRNSSILKSDTRYSSPSKQSNIRRTLGGSGKRLSNIARLSSLGHAHHPEVSEVEVADATHNSGSGMFSGMNRVQIINPLKAVGSMLKDQVGSPVAASWHRASSHVSDGADGSGSSSQHHDGKLDLVGERLKFLMMSSSTFARKSIPKQVKDMRAVRLSQSSTVDEEESKPTTLHELCAMEEVSLLQLQTELARSPASVSLPDAHGRLPLHVLGDNVELIVTPLGKSVASKFALQLMKVFPEGITTPDALGFFPFVSLIHDWEKWTYENIECKRSASKMFVPATRLFGRVADAVAHAGQEFSQAMERSIHSSNPSVSETPSSITKPVSIHLFPRVALWEDVEWCLDMLSVAMDQLGGKDGGLFATDKDTNDEQNERDYEARSILAKHVPTMVPSIVKLLLLVDGGDDEGAARKRVLQSSIFRSILLQPESVGDWITSMIRKRGLPSKRAVDYLTLVSDTTIDDYVGGFRTGLPVDKEAFQLARTEVFNAIDALEGTIASLVILGEREIERAVSTAVVWFIFSKNLARPFVVSISLIDFVLLLVLLLAFRTDVSATFAEITGPKIPTNIVYLICVNVFIRKGCEALALFNLSPAVFRSYWLNLWNIFDILAIIMVLSAYSWNQANPGHYRNGFNTFVLGLLWLKILAFMKVVNREMSTFIMALGQILKDLIYFSIVLLVVILMFADMFRIAITTKSDGTYCAAAETNATAEGGAIQDYCEPDFTYSILRTYALLLGDFSLDEYKETEGMVILFVIFTLVGVIILLNVLIAVISDSYEIAKISSHRLFGRARVSFVARNQALESFLQPGSNPMAKWNVRSPTKALATSLAFFRWCVLLSIVVTAMYSEVFLVRQAIDSIVNFASYFTLVLTVLLVIILTCALWILVFFAVGSVAGAMAPTLVGRIVRKLDSWTNRFSKATASRLFGLSKSERSAQTAGEEESEEEQWEGRMAYFDKSLEKTADRLRDELKAEIAALEKRLRNHDEVVIEQARAKTDDQARAATDDHWSTFKQPST